MCMGDVLARVMGRCLLSVTSLQETILDFPEGGGCVAGGGTTLVGVSTLRDDGLGFGGDCRAYFYFSQTLSD